MDSVELISDLASGSLIQEERKSEEVRGTYPSSYFDNMPLTSIGGDASRNFDQASNNKAKVFRQLYKEVDPEYYADEDGVMNIKPWEDHRKIVNDTKIYPFSAHGRLVMMFNGRAVYGSGTLISSRFVLTAAHNLLPRYFNREPDSIIFIPALNGNECPYGIIGVRKYYYLDEYKDGRSEDYALIELEKDIGDTTGFIDIKLHTSKEIEDKECCIFGYPGYINEELNHHLYGMSGRVTVNENLLEYTIDTSGGQSGSSIYYYSEENKYSTIGVHVKAYLKKRCNAGILLTTQRIEKIIEWKNSIVIPTKHNLAVLTTEVYGRGKELNQLGDYMRIKTQFGVIGLSGIAGVGKSTIALKFATRAIGYYDYIWWINSETEASFKSSVLDLADILRIEGKSYQQIINKLKVIMNCKAIKFLVVFDNLQDENIVKDLICTRGQYIITTRLEKIEFEKIDVPILSREASVQLLSSIIPDKPLEELEQLASFLEDLPLALLQSAAYISNQSKDIKYYIEEFYKLLDEDDKLKYIVDKNIDSLCEESQHILKIVCLGHCDNIPYKMLYQTFISQYPDTSEFDFNYFLGEIVRYNILAYDAKRDLLKIHRVIHQASTSKLDISYSAELIQHYSQYFEMNYNPREGIYIPDEINMIKYLTIHAAKFLGKYRTDNRSNSGILLYSKIAVGYTSFIFETSNSKIYQNITEELLQNTIQESDALSNQMRPDEIHYNSEALSNSMKIYNNLGLLCFKMGQFTKSEDYYLRSLSIGETVLAKNHPDIADSYNNIGLLYSNMGDYKRSEQYYLQSLRIFESLIPEDHLNLASTYNNLGALYFEMGDYIRSEEYQLKSLRTIETVLPEDHLYLATAHNNFGVFYSKMGDYNRSEEFTSKV